MKILSMSDSYVLMARIGEYIPTAQTVAVSDFETLTYRLQAEEFDCVVLDISSMNYETLQPVKAIKRISKRVGLILLSSKEILSERVEALTIGADDYLTTSIDVSELAARIISLSRRVGFSGQEFLIFDTIRIDVNAKVVFVNEVEVDFTKKELELLQYFIKHKNTIIKKERLNTFLAGHSREFIEITDSLYAHIKNLKKKLRDAGCITYLKTIYGIGYKWESH